MRLATFPSLLALVLGFSCLPGLPDELGEKGKAIFKKNQHAVVTIQLVLKNKVSVPGLGNQSNESRQDVTGTVVDPSGLTVLSLSTTDPSHMFQAIMSGLSDDENSNFKMETELSDIKILQEDGVEVAAEIVLRDKDLDLAFIRPKSKLSNPMTALELSKPGKADVLDQVITLNRLGNVAGRAYSASVERIAAIVQKPRLFYVPDSTMTSTKPGCPAFTVDGKVLGICVMRTGTRSGGASLLNLQFDNVTSIIIPAEEIAKAAKQAPAQP